MRIFEEKGYQYQKHLSTGGEGEVHLIKSVDKMFIAKVFPILDERSYRLLKDISRMEIPNTPKIYEIFNYKENTILIRDYIEGNTLYDELKKNGCFTLKRSKDIILKICDTLKAFHSAKPNPVIYRDLKPENVIVMPDGDIRLIDFGIARYYKQEATRDTILAGTRGYTAPEVMAGLQSDERSDVYSAGLLFYEMLTGKNILEPPYQIRPVAESNENLPSWIDAVIAKATDINQVNRYRSMSEFAACLENPVKVRKPGKKKTGRIAAAVLALAVLLGGGLYSYWNNMQSEGYETVLALDFDDAEDMAWVSGYEDPGDRLSLEEGRLLILYNDCNIDYIPKPGMIVHYKASMPQFASLGLSPYRLNANITFECIYYSEQEQGDCSTWNLNFDGLPFKNTGQFIDAVFYITPDSGAVYVIAADEEAGRICYTAYQIPGFLKDEPLYMEINHFSEEGSVTLEGVSVAEGSLQAYLKDHLKSYAENQKRVDALLEQDVGALPEMVFLLMNEETL